MRLNRCCASHVSATLMVCGLAAGGTSSDAFAEPVQMVAGIVTQVPTSTKSAIPGAIPVSGTIGTVTDPRYTNFGVRIFRSPTSNLWTTIATTSLATPNTADQMLLIGSGLALQGGAVAAREGVTQTTTGDILNFSLLSAPRINDAGQWAMSYRPSGGTLADDRVVKWDGTALTTVFKVTDPIPAIMGSNFAGALVFGSNVVNSATITSSGALSFFGNITSTPLNPAVFGADATTILVRVGMDTPTGTLNASLDTWVSVTRFTQDATGAHWLATGTVGSDLVVVVDGEVKIRKGFALPGLTAPVNAIADASMESNGDWFARGSNNEASPNTTGWAVKNGVVIAASGQSIVPGSAEHWKFSTTAFTDVRGNNAGNWVVMGVSDNTTSTTLQGVVVLNGQRVIARQSDQVDVEADGTFTGSLFLNSLQSDGVLNNDGYYYFFCRLKATATGTSGAGSAPNNNSVLRVRACLSDFNQNGTTTVSDIFAYLSAWFANDIRADINGVGGITVADIFAYLSVWFAGC